MSVWALVVIAAVVGLVAYKGSDGASGLVPGRWPVGVALPRAPGRPVVIMMAHPRCPCTRASLVELRRTMAESGPGIDAYVLFVEPRGTNAGFAHSDLFAEAASIPGVLARVDAEGQISSSFGALTSGHVVAYSATNQLLFSGGITGARGHEGDNPARESLSRVLRGVSADNTRAPVFGCALGETQAVR